MNRKIFKVLLPLTAALLLGMAAGRWLLPSGGEPVAGADADGREVLYWKAPMDPTYRRDAPGKSPMGMDLVPVYKEEGDDGIVSISPALINNLGVRTARAERGPLSRRIDTVGYVRYDEETVHHIHTRVDGWIETLEIRATGDPVKAGELLYELYSPTLVNAQEEFLTALKRRNPELHQASRERLAALGISAGEIKRLETERTVKQRVRVFAETDGVVAHLGVREGIYVTPATEIMSIAELDRVWVLAEVFERQSAWVAPGQRANVGLDYFPGRHWDATVDYVYPELDPETRTLTVRLKLQNAARILRPNMFARVTLFGADSAPVVHVPRAALIRGGSSDRVVLALGDGNFRAQPVEIGIESGDRIAIRAGIEAGDEIVTSAQFLLDSESNIDAALARMNDADGAAHAGHEAPAADEPDDREEHSVEQRQ